MTLKGKDIIRLHDLTRKEIEEIWKLTDEYVPVWKKKPVNKVLDGKMLATMFFQPSTRTAFTFQIAMEKLGGGYVGFAGPEYTAYAKGEPFADGVRMIDYFVDVICVRHPENGTPQKIADIADVPVINGGDGTNEHPTNAILETYYVNRKKGKLDGLNIAIIGNLRAERCAHSFAFGCAMLGAKLIFSAPKDCQFPEDMTDELKKKYNANISYMEPKEAISASDVIYVQPIFEKYYNWFKDPVDYYRSKAKYSVNLGTLKEANAKKDLLVLHCLPRLEELATDIDNDPRAGFMDMYHYCIPVRMAILDKMLGSA